MTKHCRNCKREINVSSTNHAVVVGTGKKAKWNHYGEWVCSEQCDKQACLDLESSMPGAGHARTVSTFAAEQIRKNWPPINHQ